MSSPETWKARAQAYSEEKKNVLPVFAAPSPADTVPVLEQRRPISIPLNSPKPVIRPRHMQIPQMLIPPQVMFSNPSPVNPRPPSSPNVSHYHASSSPAAVSTTSHYAAGAAAVAQHQQRRQNHMPYSANVWTPSVASFPGLPSNVALQPVHLPPPPPLPGVNPKKLQMLQQTAQKITSSKQLEDAIENWKIRSLKVQPQQDNVPLMKPSIWQKKLTNLISSTIKNLANSAKASSDWENLRTPLPSEIVYFDNSMEWEGVREFHNSKAIRDGIPRQHKRRKFERDSPINSYEKKNNRSTDSPIGKGKGLQNHSPITSSSSSVSRRSSSKSFKRKSPKRDQKRRRSPSTSSYTETSDSLTSSSSRSRRSRSSLSSRSSSVASAYVSRKHKNPISVAAAPKPKGKAKAQPKKKKNKKSLGKQQASPKKLELPSETVTREEQIKRANRLNRFGAGQEPSKALFLNLHEDDVTNVGTSQALEKQYLRITGIVDFSHVRPRNVLKQSLKKIMSKYQVSKSWNYLEEQFRSIRQDLTVQGIRDDFAIEVYETNAKMALQNSDLSQFNQCQGQLEELYRLNGVPIEQSNRASFLSYRIIYLTLQNLHMDLLRLIGELKKEEIANEKVSIALKIRKAFVEGNFCRVFKLKKCTDEDCQLLMKVFLPKLRMLYLLTMAKGHFFINLMLLERLLEFPNAHECTKFLLKEGAVLSQNNVDCRKSVSKFEESPLLLSRKIRAMLAPGASPANFS